MWTCSAFSMLYKYPRCLLFSSCCLLPQTFKTKFQEFGTDSRAWNFLSCNNRMKYIIRLPCKRTHSSVNFQVKNQQQKFKMFPVIDGNIPSLYKHVFESNAKNSKMCIKRYTELLEKARGGGGEDGIFRHTQKNKKLLVRERLKLLLDDESFLEFSPFSGFDLSYGNVPAGGCITGAGKICGVWCVFLASDATVKGGTIYPITVKKQLRAQDIALKNRLPCVYVVDSGGAFLPLQAELFPDQFHGGRIFYNEAVMSTLKIPQFAEPPWKVAVVCGSCIAGSAYIPTMAEETAIVDRIGTVFLAGPPLVKAATGEDINAEDLGGASLHAKVSGCVDHFAASEKEAYECVRNIISTLNYEIPGDILGYEHPLYSADELLGLAPQDYSYTLHIRLILSRIIDGSRFQEFKANYGTTLVTGFAYIEGQLVGVVANNGELTHDASLKGSHFIQLCNQRDIPILFLLNTAPYAADPISHAQAEDHGNRIKAQASMMAAVSCAGVPKITLIIGGCYGNESFAMCARSFDPNFLFLWPNARIALVDPRHFPKFSQIWDSDCTGEDLQQLKEKLEKESSAFYSSSRLWDDGIILPQNSRMVIAQCLRIIKQQAYQITPLRQSSFPVVRM